MRHFRYVGQDGTGREVKGKVKAESAEAVAEYLSKKNILLMDVQEVSSEGSFDWKDLAHINIGMAKVTDKELIGFTRNLASLMRAGVPIIRSLTELAAHTKTPAFKSALMDIVSALNAGKSLSAAMAEHEKIFSTMYVSAIETGESSGQLDESFLRLAKFLEIELQNKQRLKSALRYPKIVVFAMFGALLVINTVVMPAFKSLFQNFGAKLPVPTQILMATSHIINNYWYVVIPAFIALIFAVKASLKVEAIGFFWDKVKLKTPIFGPLIKKILLTRFVWSLSMMLKSGTPFPKALSLVSRSTGNRFIKQQVLQIRSDIQKGKSFSEGLKDADLFHPLTLQMVLIGEESGTLDEMLELIAKEFDEETEYSLRHLTELIEPILFLIMGIMVAILALGVFLPMWDMGQVAIK